MIVFCLPLAFIFKKWIGLMVFLSIINIESTYYRSQNPLLKTLLISF